MVAYRRGLEARFIGQLLQMQQQALDALRPHPPVPRRPGSFSLGAPAAISTSESFSVANLGFRNRVAHRYDRIDEAIIYDIFVDRRCDPTQLLDRLLDVQAWTPSLASKLDVPEGSSPCARTLSAVPL